MAVSPPQNNKDAVLELIPSTSTAVDVSKHNAAGEAT